jgi:hypothetical protein
MIERNFKNNIVWEEPDGDLLAVAPRRDVFNRDQIANLFELGFNGGLTGDGEVLAEDVGVLIGTSLSGSDVVVSLVIEGEEPYTLSRDGTELQSGLSSTDFPFTDTAPGTGEFCYAVETADGSGDESCITI